ncbi:MAG: DMT family transporter [Candidatus Latescibacteria bacterium]|nr:DMT family transporter [Candidatus Latescibacterota bacterium]
MNVLNEHLTPRASGLALLTAILWGGNSISIKIALDGMPPIALAGLRFFIGGLAVLAWALWNRIPLRLEAGDRRGLLGLVLIFLAQILLLNEGTHHTLASRSAILISSYPFFTALFAHLFIPGDRLSPLKVFGIALSFSGVILLFAETLSLRAFEHLPGDLMVLASGVLLGARHVYTKRLTQGLHPSKVLVWQAGLSLPVFILLSAIFEPGVPYHFTPAIVGAILYQGLVVAGVCFIILISLIRRYRASRLGAYGFVTPVVGVLLSALLIGEGISTTLLVSMVLVGAGIAVVNQEG